MFWSTFSRDCAISETRASRAVWKGVGGGGGGRVDAISSVFVGPKCMVGRLMRDRRLLLIVSSVDVYCLSEISLGAGCLT